MSERDALPEEVREAPEPAPARRSFWSRHPKLAIWVIAGVFYAILVGMMLFIVVLIARG